MGGRGSSGGGGGGGGGLNRATLRGTERQVSYARDLRQRANSALDEGFNEAVRTMNPTPAQMRQAQENMRNAKKILNSETDAGAIIDSLGSVSFRGSTENTFGDVMSALRRMQNRRR